MKDDLIILERVITFKGYTSVECILKDNDKIQFSIQLSQEEIKKTYFKNALKSVFKRTNIELQLNSMLLKEKTPFMIHLKAVYKSFILSDDGKTIVLKI